MSDLPSTNVSHLRRKHRHQNLRDGVVNLADQKYGIKDLDFISFIAHYVSTVHVKRAPVMLLGWSNTRRRTLHVVENWTGYVH